MVQSGTLYRTGQVQVLFFQIFFKYRTGVIQTFVYLQNTCIQTENTSVVQVLVLGENLAFFGISKLRFFSRFGQVVPLVKL